MTDAIQPRTYVGCFVSMGFQTVLDQRGLFPGDQVEAHVGVARAFTPAGDTARARKAYEAFSEYWKRAEPDVPLLLRAKTEYGKLGS